MKTSNDGSDGVISEHWTCSFVCFNVIMRVGTPVGYLLFVNKACISWYINQRQPAALFHYLSIEVEGW